MIMDESKLLLGHPLQSRQETCNLRECLQFATAPLLEQRLRARNIELVYEFADDVHERAVSDPRWPDDGEKSRVRGSPIMGAAGLMRGLMGAGTQCPCWCERAVRFVSGPSPRRGLLAQRRNNKLRQI